MARDIHSRYTRFQVEVEKDGSCNGMTAEEYLAQR